MSFKLGDVGNGEKHHFASGGGGIKVFAIRIKAAAWPSQRTKRILKWGSSSSKAVTPQFEFVGKLIVVCNSFPSTPDGQAIRSRGFSRKINVSLEEAKCLLQAAANDKRWLKSTKLAGQVMEFLVDRLTEVTLPEVSFRTLKQGYRLAERHPDSWKELFADTLPKGSVEPEKLIKELASQGLRIKDQARIFQETTGLKVRSFYNYRRDAKLSRTALIK